jgi:hypothetical protein
VSRAANRVLKDMIIGAAMSAIASKENLFADQHRGWLDQGRSPHNARRNVARSLATVMWGTWKSGEAQTPRSGGGIGASSGDGQAKWSVTSHEHERGGVPRLRGGRPLGASGPVPRGRVPVREWTRRDVWLRSNIFMDLLGESSQKRQNVETSDF